MTRREKPLHRAQALLLAATALVVTPAFAQEAAPAVPVQEAAPPPQAEPAAAAPPAAAPAEPPAPASAKVRGADPTSPTPVNPAAAAQAEAEAQSDRAAVRPARRVEPRVAQKRSEPRVARVEPREAAPAPAIVKKEPAAIASPVAVAPAKTDEAALPVAAGTRANAPTDAAVTSETTRTTQTGQTPIWPWVLLGLAVLAGLFGLIAWRRRSATDAYEPQYVEPVPTDVDAAYVAPIVAPVATTPKTSEPAYIPAAPLAEGDINQEPAVAEDATIVAAADDDVAALTASSDVVDRPWLEFAMRPIRAGSNAEEALVEIELTVGNAGAVPAHDVRISTFMLERGDDGEMDRLLLDPVDASVAPLTIEAGEGTRIDATLALLKSGMTDAAHFRPIVVADARYTLSDGSEGRTSAAFEIGLSQDGTLLNAMETERPLMHDDVEARLYTAPQHA